ncbi:MAG: CHASE2 domain-containing protein [Treponemataceae bacterium]|nr:CHASE2 domain-containing protein [Treponemataceae bacterium]
MSSKGKKTETRALSVQTAVQSGLTKTKDAGTKFFDYCVSKLEYVSAALVCAVMFLLGIFGSFDNFEYNVYDVFLRLSPNVKQNPDAMMVLIDDVAFDEIGVFPWSRDITGDMMIRLKEVGAKTATFDIEFLDASSLGVNPDYINEQLPKEYKSVQNDVLSSIDDFAQALSSKNIPLEYAGEVGQQINDYLTPQMENFYKSITANVFRDNDNYFAQALRYYGNAYLTINCFEVNTNDKTKASIEYVYDNRLYENVYDPKDFIKRDYKRWRKEQKRIYGIGPAILELIENSAGAGFPNVMVDKDGKRRRYQLFTEYNGKYVPQLVLAPILAQIQPEKIVRTRHAYRLVNAKTFGSDSDKRHDIVIPLDSEGNVLINWVHEDFVNSFKADSAYFLYFIDKVEKALVGHLDSFLNLGLRTSQGYLSYHQIAEYLKQEYQELDNIKESLLNGENDDFESYFVRRKVFFEDMAMLTSGVDEEIYAIFDSVRKAHDDESLYRNEQKKIKSLFDAFAEDLKTYNDNFDRLFNLYNGAFCVFGNTATGTTDFGITPFEDHYANMGTHVNLFNTLVTEQFITPVPRWVSYILMLGLCYISALVFRRLKKLGSRLATGIWFVVIVFLALFSIFAFLSVYVESFVILFALFTQFVLITLLRFALSEKDKNFLRKAFSTYLSGDIIDEIVKDPKKLTLGGQEKELTAIFTDVQKFSTLSEKVTPTQLVYILNVYLSRMSDIVLENKGTIDKFEGDAIIAFYGAPVDNPENARCALMSAIRMKQAEKDINEYLLSRGEAPNALLTRIGINSGPMVVGNMGTEAKMNYTIMGNDVNLAARLEGVNKVYGTWILASESSYNKAGPGFVGRRLDRVRVVGINTPVQLYNIIGLEKETPDNVIEGVELFHDALDTYFAKDFAGAIKKFEKVYTVMPDDPPTAVFLERAHKLMTTGVPDEWDGVVNMTSK